MDFEKNKVQTLTLDQLRRTHRENDVYGNPLKGVYHHQLVENIASMCGSHNFDVEIYGPTTKLRVEQDTDRLGLYHLTDPQRSLMMKMIGQSVPFRPNPES